MSDAPKSNYRGVKTPEVETPEKKIEPIEGVNAVEKKRGLGSRIKESFTGEDAQSVAQYVIFEVVIPQTKTIISDMISQGVERALFGDSRPRSSSSTIRSGYTQYNRMSSSTKVVDPRERPRERRPSNDFGEIVVAERGQAQEVLERLGDIIGMYDVATVVDLYDLVGISGSFTDNKWGWTDLRGAQVRRVSGGFLVDLPRPTPLD